MAYFKYNGKNIYYTELGAGQPLLLLHGNTASSRMFQEAAALYADQYKVILLDFLGHGQSDRLASFPADLWYEQAQQVIAFLQAKQYSDVNLIGSSGGALVAINAALEAPELVRKVIADSFEGERALAAFTANIQQERECSKHDPGAVGFYQAMQGADWEAVVDNDTEAIRRHSQEIGAFFHKPLAELQAAILLTGSLEDEFIAALAPDFFERTYGELIRKVGHGEMKLFAHGGHPAMLTNAVEFAAAAKQFLAAD